MLKNDTAMRTMATAAQVIHSASMIRIFIRSVNHWIFLKVSARAEVLQFCVSSVFLSFQLPNTPVVLSGNPVVLSVVLRSPSGQNLGFADHPLDSFVFLVVFH